MNTSGGDKDYKEALKAFRLALTRLADEIEPKVYQYGFLKE
jgi:hypothetical protein